MTTKGNGRDGWIERLTAGPLRLLTPAAMIPVLVFLGNIQTSIDNNCDATADVSQVVAALVAVDNDTSKTQRHLLRRLLERAQGACE